MIKDLSYIFTFSHQIPREEASAVPAFLLRVGPGVAGDPGSGQRPPHYPATSPVRLRQHQDCQVPRETLRRHSLHLLLRTGNY